MSDVPELPRWNDQLIDIDDYGNLVDLTKPKPSRSARGIIQHLPSAHQKPEPPTHNLQTLTAKWIKEHQ